MLRRGLLWLSEQQQVFNFVRRNRLAKRFEKGAKARRSKKAARPAGEV